MGTPRIKVFDSSGTYQASAHDYAAAACLMGLYGEGATVRLGHSRKDVIWTEGRDGSVADNFDLLGEVIDRHDERQRQDLERMMSTI